VRGGRNACVEGKEEEETRWTRVSAYTRTKSRHRGFGGHPSLAPLLTFPADQKTFLRETKWDPNSSIQVKKCIQMIALYKNGRPEHDARVQKPTEFVAQMDVAVAVCAYAVAVAVSLGSVVYAVSTAVLVL
jgi:hypothetical protein